MMHSLRFLVCNYDPFKEGSMKKTSSKREFRLQIRNHTWYMRRRCTGPVNSNEIAYLKWQEFCRIAVTVV